MVVESLTNLNITGFIVDIAGPALMNNGTGGIFLFAVFVSFVVMTKKLISFIKNMFFISIISAAFPFVVNYSGYASLPISFASVALFVALGVGSYLAFIVIHALLKVGKIFGGGGGKKVVYKYGGK